MSLLHESDCAWSVMTRAPMPVEDPPSTSSSATSTSVWSNMKTCADQSEQSSDSASLSEASQLVSHLRRRVQRQLGSELAFGGVVAGGGGSFVAADRDEELLGGHEEALMGDDHHSV